jgi:hypothetical protein
MKIKSSITTILATSTSLIVIPFVTSCTSTLHYYFNGYQITNSKNPEIYKPFMHEMPRRTQYADVSSEDSNMLNDISKNINIGQIVYSILRTQLILNPSEQGWTHEWLKF